MTHFYPIGTPGRPWTDSEKQAWRAQTTVQRSYADEVRAKIDKLAKYHRVQSYGALSVDPERFPLYAILSESAGASRPWVLVTGGVHGYETSGVQGALAAIDQVLPEFQAHFNFAICPCVSPWGYERIQRWNPFTIDPNRNFVANSPAEECAFLFDFVATIPGPIFMHLDLHETTDSDEEEFRPALAARDGKDFEASTIPDGFYTVADRPDPQLEFQKAMIAGVREVTHIAPADENNELIGSPVLAEGIIAYPFKELGLCAGLTQAPYTSTTEVYPDSEKASPENCIEAQLAALRSTLAFIRENPG